MARRRWGEEDGSGMAGRWSRGREEYEPCGIGLTSHSLPSAAQDMWGWTFPTPLILFLWVGETTAHHRSTADREGGGERGRRAAEENVRDQRRWVRSRYTNGRWGGSGRGRGAVRVERSFFLKKEKEIKEWEAEVTVEPPPSQTPIPPLHTSKHSHDRNNNTVASVV